MLIGHGIFIFFYLMKKCMSKKSDLTFYSKTVCVVIMIIGYMATFLNLQFVSLTQDILQNREFIVNLPKADCQAKFPNY